jgi:DNA (cytosine-5)-methyltransferase 1
VRYLSVCSGIEAASVAWESLGWTPVAFAEIEKFPSKVLAHHYPEVANLGDMTRFREWDIDRNSVDVLVGGTPCQSFSVAGLRKGLDDPRGNLALTFIAMVDHYRPEWVIWENVPGVLSSSGGRDFGSFLGALGNIGYGFAYRVLDAQYFGVPQRRRRVFVVAHSSGDSRRAAEVLFEPESLRGDSPKSNRKGKETSYSFTASLGIGSPKVSGTLCALDGPNGVNDQYANEAKLIVMADGQAHAAISTNEIAPTLNSSIENPIVAYNTLVSETSHCVLASGGQRNDPHTETMVPVTYRKSRRAQSAEDFETWIPDGVTNTLNCFDLGDIRSVDIVVEPIALAENTIGRQPMNGGNGDGYTVGGPMYTLNATGVHGVAHPAHAFKIRGVGHYTGTNGGIAKPGTGGSGYMGQDEKAYTIATSQDQQIMHGMAVRRLTPTECERLQGFPDGYTDIMPETSDGPRYKALGNSMAVPVMRWIGSRIALATK